MAILFLWNEEVLRCCFFVIGRLSAFWDGISGRCLWGCSFQGEPCFLLAKVASLVSQTSKTHETLNMMGPVENSAELPPNFPPLARVERQRGNGAPSRRHVFSPGWSVLKLVFFQDFLHWGRFWNWANYSDLSRGHPKWCFFLVESPPPIMSWKFRNFELL